MIDEERAARVHLCRCPLVEGALFAAVQLARLSGDRSRDLDDSRRVAIVDTLRTAGASPGWERLVSEAVGMEGADEARALGDTLPVGLRLA